MSKVKDRKLAAYLRAMAHPVRLQILRQLAKKDDCITGDITRRLPVAPSTASQHLKALQEAGLITARPDGLKRRYSLMRKRLDEAQALCAEL